MASKRMAVRVAVFSAVVVLLCGETFAQASVVPCGGKVIAHYTFEPGEEVKWGGMGKREGWYSLITTDPAEVISGKGSLKCDATRSSGWWHGFLFTLPGMLKRNSAYFISFKYRVLKFEKDATLCLFLRSPTALSLIHI